MQLKWAFLMLLLQMLAVKEGFAEQMARLKEQELSRELHSDMSPDTPEREPEVETPGGPDDDLLNEMKQKGQ